MNKSRRMSSAVVGAISLLLAGPVAAQFPENLMRGLGVLKGAIEHAEKQAVPTATQGTVTATETSNSTAGDSVGVPANAAEYCAAIKASPLVQEYVKVLARGVETGAMSFDKGVRDYADLRFDNEDGLLQKWVSAAKTPGSLGGKTRTSPIGRDTIKWASECAAENHNNDLFLFFIDDLREPAAIAAMRERANQAIKSFREVKQVTRLDRTGQPVIVQLPPPIKLEFNLDHENSSYGVERQSVWVTLSAFAIQNGTKAMESSGSNASKILSDLVDDAVVAREQHMAKVEAEKRELEKQETIRVSAEAKSKAEADAARNSPTRLLFRSYEAYQIVEACFEARKGYAAVYFSEAEMSGAKDKMRKIDSNLKPKLVGTTSDQLWEKAAADNESIFKGLKTAPYQNNRDMCSIMANELASLAEKVLGKGAPKKAF